MAPSSCFTRRAAARAAAFAVIVLSLPGCAGPLPAVAPEDEIAAATGLPGAVTFEVEGEPLDAPGGDPAALSPGDAVARALQTDPRVQQSLAAVRVALAQADQARRFPNPLLNVILKYPAGGGAPNIEAGLSESLVGVLTAPRRASAADQRLRAASADAVTTALDVVADVREVYIAAQSLTELVPVLEERRRLVDRLLSLARDRLAAGEGTRIDVTALDAQRVELEVEIAERQQEQRDARLRLTRLVGQPSGDADWTLERWQAPPPVASAESAWIDAALAHRPEVQAAAWELAARGDDRALAGFAPFDAVEAGVKGDRDGSWAAGPDVTLPLPLFDDGGAQRAQADAEQIAARHALTQARRQAVEDVRRALQAFTASRENLERVERELLPLQQERRSRAEDAYSLGLADLDTVLLAEQDLQASLARRVQVEQDTALALLRLQRAVGGSGVAAQIAATAEHGP